MPKLRRVTDPKPIRGGATILLSVAMAVIGLVLIVRTLTAGGGPLATGVILGALFVAAGVGRAYIGRLSR
jgi:hypothetical protein